jgi:hypothetical protein
MDIIGRRDFAVLHSNELSINYLRVVIWFSLFAIAFLVLNQPYDLTKGFFRTQP